MNTSENTVDHMFQYPKHPLVISNHANFEPFPKIPRLRRTIVVTEKIDGTNAQIYVAPNGQVWSGSRNKWVFPEKGHDHYNFGAWVKANEDQLRKDLGPGRHYGEWWGAGIQRGYGLSDKRFSLFNTARWKDDAGLVLCKVVPVLYIGNNDDSAIEACLMKLREYGSMASPGYMNPEGVVVYHSASGNSYKVLLENDELHKGEVLH